MAESVLLTLSTKILSSIVSPVAKKAYEKGVFIWKARDELAKLRVTMSALREVLQDAEKKEQDSDAINGWVQRLKGVFYDAEDLFDEIATEDLLKKQMREGMSKLSLKKVWFYCSSFTTIVLSNSIAKRVEAIRERLDSISAEKNQFGFKTSGPVINTRGEKIIERPYKYAKLVIGRDDDMKAILKMLIDDAHQVIVIDGIGGMGKTTLARLIYNHEEVKKIFDINRWFACIPDKSNGKEVLGKIYQSICERSYDDLGSIQLEEKIRESIIGKKYLLVLDDVWDDNPGEWDFRKSLLSNGAKGSKIIVTTRLQSVANALGEVSTCSLKGLSKEDSWNLFKDLSFAPGSKEESRRESLGKELVERCRGVPLAISCMGNLLRNKTVREWEEIKNLSFPRLRGGHSDETMSILKLSYDHLPSNLKQCFTYCSLFPKDYRYNKEELIYHWIAQGYINLDEEESNFMHLVRMGFFQEMEDDFGAIVSCKMHDIMHDLAMHLSGEESIMQNGISLNVGSCTRHVSLTVGGEDGELWDIPASLLNVNSIRTCMLSGLSSQHSQPNLDQLCSNFKLLRTLTLSRMGIEHIPPSIGELKLVRHLDLSWNNFTELPDSITNLVNLLTLNLKRCVNLTAWPCNFKNFIKLRSLKIEETYKLLSMPEGIEGMKSLHYLSDLKVEERSELDKYNELLERVRGSLSITFRSRMEVKDEWVLPAATSLQHLGISFYPGREIRGWDKTGSQMKLQRVQLSSCENVKYLPPMSCLPDLKVLHLEYFPELEFMEDEEEVNTRDPPTSQKFFPCLEKLTLINMPKLKGWRRNLAGEAMSTSSTPGFPGEALASLRELVVKRCHSLKILHLASPHLLKIDIDKCDELISIKLAERPSILSESEIASN